LKSAFGSSTRGHRFDTLFTNGASKVATSPSTRSTYCYQVADLNDGSHLLTYTADNAFPGLNNVIQRHFVSGFRHFRLDNEGCDFSCIYPEITAGKLVCTPGWLGKQPVFLVLMNPEKGRIIGNQAQIDVNNPGFFDKKSHKVELGLTVFNQEYRWPFKLAFDPHAPAAMKFLKSLSQLKGIEVVLMPCGIGELITISAEISVGWVALKSVLAGISTQPPLLKN
jgi:hypothetical protein